MKEEGTVAEQKNGSTTKARTYFCKFEHGLFTAMKQFWRKFES